MGTDLALRKNDAKQRAEGRSTEDEKKADPMAVTYQLPHLQVSVETGN